MPLVSKWYQTYLSITNNYNKSNKTPVFRHWTEELHAAIRGRPMQWMSPTTAPAFCVEGLSDHSRGGGPTQAEPDTGGVERTELEAWAGSGRRSLRNR